MMKHIIATTFINGGDTPAVLVITKHYDRESNYDKDAQAVFDFVISVFSTQTIRCLARLFAPFLG